MGATSRRNVTSAPNSGCSKSGRSASLFRTERSSSYFERNGARNDDLVAIVGPQAAADVQVVARGIGRLSSGDGEDAGLGAHIGFHVDDAQVLRPIDIHINQL